MTESSDDSEEFEALLDSGFSALQFSNDLLKATNGDPSTTELDIETPIKKIYYDLNEVEMRIERLINTNPTGIIDQMFKGKSLKNATGGGLKPSLEYLEMSYQRLQEEVLEPYERAQKLQNVLSKVHQTSILLRDGLIYVHSVNRIQEFPTGQNQLSIEKAIQLVSLHCQIQMSVNENANLRSLRLIKQLETDVISPNKRELLSFLSSDLITECTNDYKIKQNKANISKLARALYMLSQPDLMSTIQKIIVSSATTSIQNLTKTINSIKNFPVAFEAVVKKGYSISLLESILGDIKTEKSNLLKEYSSQIRPKAMSPKQLYWGRVAANFKKEFEISYNRGGPVGKSFLKNQDMITETIKKNMVDSTDGAAYENDMNTMLESISIIKRRI